LVGLLNRLRLRGGITDELLAPFFESGGNTFELNKNRNPLLSPFGPRTTRPIFLSNATQGAFDNVAPRERANWYSDWALRALGLSLSLQDVRDLYAEVLPLLVRAGILKLHEAGTKRYWGLYPEALFVSRNHAFRICGECGYEQPTVAGGPSDPLHHPCPRYRCQGQLQQRSAQQESRAQTYYRRFYERKALGRVWSSEHTGLLERNDREDLELAFKQRPRPDSPNMLSRSRWASISAICPPPCSVRCRPIRPTTFSGWAAQGARPVTP
jgi:DEAD/DEAH box helicase domain-containing protein